MAQKNTSFFAVKKKKVETKNFKEKQIVRTMRMNSRVMYPKFEKKKSYSAYKLKYCRRPNLEKTYGVINSYRLVKQVVVVR